MSTYSVPLHHLPVRSLSAAANMAVDALLLEQYPYPDAPRFRHYGWANPAFTFGRTGSYEAARRTLPVHVSWQDAHERFAKAFELIRRPTGGGVVDHRSDWTYALVIPASHPLFRVAATTVYRDCHRVLVAALAEQGIVAALAPCQRECGSGVQEKPKPTQTDCSDAVKPVVDSFNCGDNIVSTDSADAVASAASTISDGSATSDATNASTTSATSTSLAASATSTIAEGACFSSAEPHDVVGQGGAKLAGAAQRRSREGLLVQGSVSREEVGGINWQRFERDVAEGFGRWLAVSDGLPQPPPQPASVLVREMPLPKWDSVSLQARIAQFSSPQWNRRR